MLGPLSPASEASCNPRMVTVTLRLVMSEKLPFVPTTVEGDPRRRSDRHPVSSEHRWSYQEVTAGPLIGTSDGCELRSMAARNDAGSVCRCDRRYDRFAHDALKVLRSMPVESTAAL